MNRVTLLGRVSDPPQSKNTGRSELLSFRVATVEQWTGRDGQAGERTAWHRCVAWGQLAATRIAEGDLVLIEGRLSNRSYEGKDGKKQYITEVNATSIERLDAQAHTPQRRGEQRTIDQRPSSDDDELPF